MVAEADSDEVVPRWPVSFACAKGHVFEVLLAADAESPDVWECRNHGIDAKRVGAKAPAREMPPPRTHWDMVLERRSIADLEVLLDEALYKLRQERQASA